MTLGLKYHQATYDLLTNQPIDVQKAIDSYEQHFAAIIRSSFGQTLEGEALDKAIVEHRQNNLVWTTLDLFQRPVQFSQENTRQLDAIEEKYQVRLPAAVREWYSLDIVPAIMSVREPGYLPISEIKPLPETIYWQDSRRTDLWFFVWDEYIDQGGEPISFKIDGGDDPPVFAKYSDRYIKLESQFSRFIYLHFWDWHSRYMFEYGFHLRRIMPYENQEAKANHRVPIEHLKGEFTELTSEYALRFHDTDSRVWPVTAIPFQKANDSDTESNLVGGEFRANSLDALTRLIARIWGENAPVFEMGAYTANNESVTLIDQMQRDLMRKVLLRAGDWITHRELAFQLGARLENMSTTMFQKLQGMVERGEVEAHPDNSKQVGLGTERLQDRYRRVH